MSTAESLRAHLEDQLLPLWAEHGLDRERGGFLSRLDHAKGVAPDACKRLLVQTRQVFVFSQAAARGMHGADALAAGGLDFLRERFWDAHHGGFYTTIEHDGTPLDRGKDLYTHAFVLLALAGCASALGDAEALALAHRTRELLDEHLADARHGGFLEGGDEAWTPVDGARRQNPHMHLLEAYLALASCDDDPAWLDGAAALVGLLETRFVDAETGVLREHFGPDWSRLDHAAGRVVEPGHHFEWVALLADFERQTGRASGLSEALFRFGESAGLDTEHGGVYDEVDADGAVVRDTKRLWPQTEYVRARVERGDRDAVVAAVEQLFRRYHDPETGGWREHASRDGTQISEYMNATSVYHVWTALAAAAALLGGAGVRNG